MNEATTKAIEYAHNLYEDGYCWDVSVEIAAREYHLCYDEIVKMTNLYIDYRN